MRLSALVFWVTQAALAAGPYSGPVEFRKHAIDANIPGGYAVAVADMNHDGRPDVIGITQRVPELAWYENPNWERHVMVTGLESPVNLAVADIDGDGIPEVAVQDGFSMVAARSPGRNWLLHHKGDPRQPWDKFFIDEIVTSHHIAWADIDGDSKLELINAPLIGSKALAPKYEDHVTLYYYRVPAKLDGPWKRLPVDDTYFGILHRVRVVHWDSDNRDDLLTTSFNGIKLHRALGAGDNLHWETTLISKGHEEEAPKAGASDVRIGMLGSQRILAAIEPWHGNEVVTYTQEAGKWTRHVLYDKLTEGHEICLADFNGDGMDDLVAGDRGQGGSAHVFYAKDQTATNWEHVIVDEGKISGSGCATADINGDGRPDFIMIGSRTSNLNWYENTPKAH